MNIKTTKNNIEELGIEVLAICPADQTEAFVDGYIEYVSIFIEDVKFFYGLVENIDGSCYVDIEDTCESTTRQIQLEALSDEYLAGSLTAEVNILKAFVNEFGKNIQRAA